MADRTLPPQVEGPSQGRLDMIVGRPSLFPAPKATQTFVFTFRWWGDTRPCVLRLPPNKSEVRIVYHITCSPRSFRQYLLDAGSLHVSLRIEGSGKLHDMEEDHHINNELQNLKKSGIETPRQKLLRRQLRLKKGWQDGDVVGSFMLPDMKLNTRGDYVRECRIVDSSADIVGTIVVTLVFLEGSLDDFHHLKISNDEETSPNDKSNETKPKSRPSGIPVREAHTSKIPKNVNEGYRPRSRSSSFRSSPRPKSDPLKSPRKQPGEHLIQGYQGKENEAPPRMREAKGSQPVESQEPQVVLRRGRGENQSLIRERPASWGLYPLLNGADPYSLVESGAVKKEDLPILMQVLEGRSPSLDLSNLDPDTQKLLEGLDLSMSFSGISTTSSGRSFSRGETSGMEKQGEKPRSQGFSVFKGNEQDGISFSGVSMTSGVWPLERVEESQGSKTVLQERAQPHVSPRAARRLSQAGSAKSKIPMSHAGSKSPGTACRSLLSRPTADRPISSMSRDASFTSKDEEELSEIQENGPLGRRSSDGPSTRRGSEEEGSVLVVDVGTLTLAPSLLPARPPDKKEKISGVKVMHRSRVCYLTTLEVKLPGVEIPPEWDLSQTCASRQLLDNEINYNIREVLKLPPAPALEILRGQLEIRSVCRRLGERDSEEVGSASVSMMDLWQLSGSEVQVPLFRSEVPDGKDSLTKRRRAKRKEEGDVKQSYANLTFTARLGLAVGQSHHAGELEEPWELHHRKGSHEVGSHVGHPDSKPREIPYLSKLREKGYTHALPSTPPPHSGPRSHRDPDGEDREVIRIFKPRPVPPESYEPFQSAVFNSIYLPTHMSPRDKIYNGSWQQQPKQPGRVEVVDNILSSPVPTKVVNDAGFRIYQGSFLAGINGHEPQTNNQPIESGGESPCIRTIGDFHADYIEHALLNRRSSAEMKQEERRGSCRVHLEILKGRNLPWVEGTDGTLKPPSCYVRATIGSHNIQTNICLEADNPMWNYAADVLLPYSQLCQTDGNLILKVHHGSWDQPPSLEDPLMGFVCVDATSIWSGHVSLCGWYPLLDLRGCVRGHLKVSLTPHEPPQAGGPPRKACYSVNLHENVGQKVMAETYRSGATYSQRSDKSSDTGLRESQSHVASDSESSKRESLKPLSPNILQKHSPKSQRKKYSSGSDGSVSDASSSPYKNVESSVYSKYSVISSGSVVVDGEVLNDVSGFHGGVSSKKSSSPRETLHSTTGVENRTSYDRKYSSIPVFSPHKDSNKLADQENERRKASDNLPEVSYREKENKTPSTSVHSQGFCRHKGTVIVKGIATDSDKVSGSGAGSRGSEDSDHGTPKMERRKGSILLKDSLIVSHFRMQKEEDSNKEMASQENILPTQVPSSPRFGDKERTSMSKEGHELQSQPSQPPVSTSGTSTTVDKPSSCLKVPGSPSLRAKHVTFAHKLVQHQDRDGSSDQNRRQSGLTQQSQDLYRTGHETFGNAGIDRNILDSESRQKSPRGHVPTERSDLQVVPCREGDTQVVTTTVSAQGSRSYSVVSGFDSKGMMEARKSRDNRSDLIMAFSWMNQSSGSDTPCVSFIEQRQNAKEGESVGKSHHVNNSADNKGSPDMGNHTGSPQKKSRKFRNRLAANFHLK